MTIREERAVDFKSNADCKEIFDVLKLIIKKESILISIRRCGNRLYYVRDV